MRIFTLLFSLMWLVTVCVADEAGTAGDALLRIGVGARASAMGDTFVAVADDVHSIYWNPAGLHQIERSQLAAMHAEWFAETRYEWVGFVQSFGSWLSAGVDVGYLYTGEITRTVETGFGGYRTDGTFSYTNRILRLALGSGSYHDVRIGAALQVLRQGLNFAQTQTRVPDRHADDVSLNFGVLYEPPFTLQSGGNSLSTLRVGASLQNVGGKASGLIREDSDLPTIFKLGASLQLQPLPPAVVEDEETSSSAPGNILTLAVDLNIPAKRSVAVHTGIEYQFRNGFIARGGYRGGTGLDFLSSWSLGAGYRNGSYQLDYALTPFGSLGNTHRVSMTLNF